MSLASPDMRRSGSRFVESVEHIQPPATSSDLGGVQQSWPPPVAPPSSPPPSAPPTSPPPQPPFAQSPSVVQVLPTLSHIADAKNASSRALRTVPAIHVTSPTLATVLVSSPPTSQLPVIPQPPKRINDHALLPSATYQPSRPVSLPPQQQQSPARESSQSSVLSDSASGFSNWTYASNGTRMTERSWRDSTISALDKVITDGEEDPDGEGMQSEGLKEVRI
jgi:hypothetical protein